MNFRRMKDLPLFMDIYALIIAKQGLLVYKFE
jgi:hypothetical protein